LRTKLLIGIISLFLFFIGFNNYQNFLSFFLDFIPELAIVYNTLWAQVLQSLFFGLLLSSIPILSLILWIKFKIQHNRIKIYIILLFLVSSIIASVARTLILKCIYQRAFNAMPQPKPFIYDAENLNYNVYIFLGEIITFILLYFILKKNQKQEDKKINDKYLPL